MIARLRGILLEKQPPHILLDINGVAYELEAPLSTFYQLPAVGEIAILHTYFVVREDAQLLYGFSTLQEKELFCNLIKVNNIGPKLAVSILSGMSPDNFVHCILANDLASLVRLPGVGRKTAERLIIEMRDRLAAWVPTILTPAQSEAEQLMHNLPAYRSDALSGLISLGYKSHEASRALSKVKGDNFSTAELIKLALQQV